MKSGKNKQGDEGCQTLSRLKISIWKGETLTALTHNTWHHSCQKPINNSHCSSFNVPYFFFFFFIFFSLKKRKKKGETKVNQGRRWRDVLALNSAVGQRILEISVWSLFWLPWGNFSSLPVLPPPSNWQLLPASGSGNVRQGVENSQSISLPLSSQKWEMGTDQQLVWTQGSGREDISEE